MNCTVTRGYYGHVLVQAEGNRSGVFEPGRRTLTGARHRNGQLRCMSAASLLRYLGIDPGAIPDPHDSIECDSKGIFDHLTPVDISMHAAHVYRIVSVPLRSLAGACALESKPRKEKKHE